MNKIQGTITKKALAEYTALLQYTSAWQNLDQGPLQAVLDQDVIFDAPGISFPVVGYNKVLDAHRLFFDNLREENIRLSENQKAGQFSSYEVFTQIYPYENKGIYPFMQLSYFTEIGFLKLVYFFVDLDSGMGKIAKIKTHSTKFLVDPPNTKRSVRKIQELLGKIKTL